MKILHLIQRYPPAVGGAETWCREVCRYLASRKDRVKVLTLDVIEEEEYWRDPPLQRSTMRLGKLDWDDGVFVRRYKRSLPIHTLYHLGFKWVLDRALRIYFYGPHSLEMYGRVFAEARAAEVIHLHTIPHPHNFIGYVAARLAGKRVVITPHFHPDHPYYERWSNYLLLKRCDAVITVSEYERDYLISKGIEAAKIIVTGNGVHPADYYPGDLPSFKAELLRKYHLSESTKLVLFVGRKREYKGIDTLVDAFRQLSRRDDAALFLVGPPSSWFSEFYAQLPAQERRRIIDLGTVSHAEKVNLLHLADVLVLPSRFEAFGIVLLEAWVCGTPVIGAATGAIPSIVGDSGLTFEYGDAVALADKLATLLHDDQRAKEMGHSGQQKVLSRYTWEKIGMVARTAYRPQEERMRILICSNLFPPHVLGGAELVAYKYAKILQAWGHDVRIFAGRLSGARARLFRSSPDQNEFHKTWVKLSQRDLNSDLWDFRNEPVRRAFSKVLEDFSPHVVHLNNLVGLSVELIDECHKRGLPTVLTLHDYWGICFKNIMLKNDGTLCLKGGFDCLGCRETLGKKNPLPSPVRNAILLRSLIKVDRLIAPSHYVVGLYAANGIPRDKLSVVDYGLDLQSFKAVQKNTDVLTLGFVGNLGKHKGVAYLLQALTLLNNLEKIRLLIVGAGVEAEHLRAFCRDHRLDRYVTFYGHVDNQQMTSIYDQIDVLVVPSAWPETRCLVIAEAMASGIPVIASDIGAIKDLVEEGGTGLLVPPKDPRALADRIDYLLTHAELRREMGEKALANIRRYRIETQVALIAKIYRELLDRNEETPRLGADVLLYDSDQLWDLPLQEAFRQLAELERKLARRLLVYRMDHSDRETLRVAKLLLITSPSRDSRRRALQAFQWQIPIVVHAKAWELKELCLASNAGLFYTDAEERQECLALLLSNESLRLAMGENGRRFVEHQMEPSTAAS